MAVIKVGIGTARSSLAERELFPTFGRAHLAIAAAR
jgi:hypothetical protein